MKKKESLLLLEKELDKYRARTYLELIEMVNSNPIVNEIRVSAETTYQIEISAQWDNNPGKDIRVFGAIDNGGLWSFFPTCSDFIMASDNTIMDE